LSRIASAGHRCILKPPEVGVIDAKSQTLPLQRELVGRPSPFRSAEERVVIFYCE